MRSVTLLRFLLLTIAGLLAVTDAALAEDRATYTALAGLPGTRSQGYSIAIAPPGYPAVELYAEETGRGPTILSCMASAPRATLRRIIPSLAATHRVITLDLRGFGRSNKPFDQHYSALDQAAHVKEFIRRRGFDREITLAGHSFGSAVAIALALDLNRTQPQLISRLILMNAPAFPQPLSPAVGFLRAPVLAHLALNLIPPQITAQMSLSNDMGNFGHITEDDVARYATPLGESGGAHALITTAQRIVPPNLPDLVRRYPTIRQPTLLVWCRRDPVVPLVTGISLKRMLPRARLRIIGECTHVPPEESPGELLMHMQMFLSSRY
jgi:pimeloyl-ACP methyl ester carboxylesterase